MWEPRSHDTLVLPQTSWQQPPSPRLYVPIVSSSPAFSPCLRLRERATPQPGSASKSTENPPPRKRRKLSHQQDSLRKHEITVISDQSFIVLHQSRANFIHEIKDQRGAKLSPRIVNAADEYIGSRVRDLELHAEWWLKYHGGVGDNDVVLLAMNLFGDKQYDFDIYGCEFSVVARPDNVQMVSMRERMDVGENRV